MENTEHAKTVSVPSPVCGVQMIVVDDRLHNEDGSINQLVKGTEGSAGYDLTAWPKEPVVLEPHQKAVMIPLGFKLFIQHNALAGMVYPRSGMGHKKGLVLGNTIGVIDSDYQGEMFLSAYNRGDEPITINPGDRVAQLVFQQVYHPQIFPVSSFGIGTGRGSGGFGSTGISEVKS